MAETMNLISPVLEAGSVRSREGGLPLTDGHLLTGPPTMEKF